MNVLLFLADGELKVDVFINTFCKIEYLKMKWLTLEHFWLLQELDTGF